MNTLASSCRRWAPVQPNTHVTALARHLSLPDKDCARCDNGHRLGSSALRVLGRMGEANLRHNNQQR